MFGESLLALLLFSDSAFAATSPSPSLLSLSNPSVQNDSLEARRIRVQCGAPEYGSNLNVESCEKVMLEFNQEDKVVAFAERPGDPSETPIPLPWRALSSK